MQTGDQAAADACARTSTSGRAVNGATGARDRRGAGARRARRARADSRPGICPPARRAGWRWRGCWSADRPIWLLDEPTAALDADGEALVGATDRPSICDSGGIAVVATHHDLAPRAAARRDAWRSGAARMSAVRRRSSRRDLKLAFRAGGDALTLVLFFVMVGAIVPFAIGPDRALLARLAPGHRLDRGVPRRCCSGSTGCSAPTHEDGSLLLLPPRRDPARGHRCRKVDRALAAHRPAADRREPRCSRCCCRWIWRPGWQTVLSLLLGTPALVALRRDRRRGHRGAPARRADRRRC